MWILHTAGTVAGAVWWGGIAVFCAIQIANGLVHCGNAITSVAQMMSKLAYETKKASELGKHDEQG